MKVKQCGSENPLLMTGLTWVQIVNLKFQCSYYEHVHVTTKESQRIIAYFLSWNCRPKESSPIRILKDVWHKPSQQPNTIQNCKQQNTKKILSSYFVVDAYNRKTNLL